MNVKEGYYISRKEMKLNYAYPILIGYKNNNIFSDEEVDYITKKLIPQRELEDLLCKKALEIVSSVGDQEKKIKKSRKYVK